MSCQMCTGGRWLRRTYDRHPDSRYLLVVYEVVRQRQLQTRHIRRIAVEQVARTRKSITNQQRAALGPLEAIDVLMAT